MNNDLISRRYLLDELEQAVAYYEDMDECAAHTILKCRRMVQDAPSVERPKGRWIPPDFVSDDFWTCSTCGVEWFMEDDGGWNFCPNCGADMREDADHGTE